MVQIKKFSIESNAYKIVTIQTQKIEQKCKDEIIAEAQTPKLKTIANWMIKPIQRVVA